MTLPIILFALAAVAFGILWYTGQLKRFTAYVQDTREELKKCTWPTWDELKESTVLVMLVSVILGLFTVVVDIAFTFLAQKIG